MKRQRLSRALLKPWRDQKKLTKNEQIRQLTNLLEMLAEAVPATRLEQIMRAAQSGKCVEANEGYGGSASFVVDVGLLPAIANVAEAHGARFTEQKG